MTFVCHGFVAYTATVFLPMLVGVPAEIYLPLGILAGLVGTTPDTDGEREKWSVTKQKTGNVTTWIIVRDGEIWKRYGRWHVGDLRAWARKYWVWPILLHVDVVDPLIHPPTALVDREKHPKLYGFVWVCLEVAIWLACFGLLYLAW